MLCKYLKINRIFPSVTKDKSYEKLVSVLEFYISSPRNFPWHWYGDMPKYGSTHSYLCKILLPFFHPLNQNFLSGSPKFSEIQKLANSMTERNIDHLLLDVVKYCERLSDMSDSKRRRQEVEVFVFLCQCTEIIKDLELRTRKSLGMSLN